MTEESVKRRLAAMLGDVASYSQLMSEDREGTLAALTAHRSDRSIAASQST